jgi:hypothetical protein
MDDLGRYEAEGGYSSLGRKKTVTTNREVEARLDLGRVNDDPVVLSRFCLILLVLVGARGCLFS